MAYLVVEKGSREDIGRNLPLDERTVLIGCPSSTSTPDFPINSCYVSRRHAEVIYHNGQFMLRDNGSLNGTEIDGQRIESNQLYPLRHNSKIVLAVSSGEASVVLRFIAEEETTPAIIQRAGKGKQSPVDWLIIDEDRREVRVDGEMLLLPKKEYLLLLFLSRKAGNVCSRDEIIAEVWSEVQDPGAVSDATIAQLIHRLRDKIEPDPSKPKRICSKHGFGYMLV